MVIVGNTLRNKNIGIKMFWSFLCSCVRLCVCRTCLFIHKLIISEHSIFEGRGSRETLYLVSHAPCCCSLVDAALGATLLRHLFYCDFRRRFFKLVLYALTNQTFLLEPLWIFAVKQHQPVTSKILHLFFLMLKTLW